MDANRGAAGLRPDASGRNPAFCEYENFPFGGRGTLMDTGGWRITMRWPNSALRF
jgi:hypothetical protein